VHIPIHHFDRERVAGMLKTYEQSVLMMLEQAASRPHALAVLISDALAQAGLLAALEPDANALPRLVRLSGRSGAALFSLARADGHTLELPLATDNAQPLSGQVDESQLHVGRWLTAYWAATVARDVQSLALLCATTDEQLLRSSSKADAFLHHLAQAARSFFLKDEAAMTHLLEALRHTDPQSAKIAPADYVLDLSVPTIELFFTLLDNDEAGFDETLAKALKLHANYWGRANRRDDPEGLLALPLAALLVLARAHGMSPATTSDYIPQSLLAAGAQSVMLTLCPYCLTPINEEATVCPGCLQDPRKDAAIEMETTEYEQSPRKRCVVCGSSIFKLAVRCPVCRHRQ
jgi:hypothetical protein